MNVRPATTDDLPSIKTILNEFKPGGYDTANFESAADLIINDENRDILVVDVDGELVGLAIVNIVQELAKREARIGEVVVSSAHRGMGYGSAIMSACDAWAFERGADAVEFTSRPSREAANALYQKLGYQLRETNVYQRKRGQN